MKTHTVVIGLGANLPSLFGDAQATLSAAIKLIAMQIGEVELQSPWYKTSPVGVSDQPDFINGAVLARTTLDPATILRRLHAIEETLGRTRDERWSARTADLDLLLYEDRIGPSPEAWQAIVDDPDPAAYVSAPMLPHPRLHERAFALKPLYDVWPGWVHPVYGEVVATMLARLPDADDPVQVDDHAEVSKSR